MVDTMGMDPARIERLRSADRLAYFHPDRIWEVLKPAADCTLVDIGAGVGFLTLPFAAQFPKATAFGCDILDGMVGLLRQDAVDHKLDNLQTILMTPNAVDLPDDSADFIVMGQLHHELDTPEPLMVECKRLLKPGGIVAIIDWADADNGKSPPVGRRVPVAQMRTELENAGFTDVKTHDVYEYHTFMTAQA
ncbi:MAG: SAM-dependent methyltransferase [Alphaproteobacteria bacterium]|jgi:SAM-dependent methyltransferase